MNLVHSLIFTNHDLFQPEILVSKSNKILVESHLSINLSRNNETQVAESLVGCCDQPWSLRQVKVSISISTSAYTGWMSKVVSNNI